MSRVLLLGATGFIGRAVQAQLVADGHDVLRHASHRIDDSVDEAVDLVDARPGDVDALLARAEADVIVNCVGRTRGRREELQGANVTATAHVLDALLAAPDTIYVHLGSSAEYGATPVDEPTDEDWRGYPFTLYGQCKSLATGLVLDQARRLKLRGAVLRVFNPVGAGASATSFAGSAAEEIRRALAVGDDRATFGGLDTSRDFVSLRDVAAAVGAVVRATPRPVDVYNVGSGSATSFRSLVSMVAMEAGFEGDLCERPKGSLGSTGVPWQEANISKIHDAFGWRPTDTLAHAVRELWWNGAGPTP